MRTARTMCARAAATQQARHPPLVILGDRRPEQTSRCGKRVVGVSHRARFPGAKGQGAQHPMGVRCLMRIHTDGVCVRRRGEEDSRVVFETDSVERAPFSRAGSGWCRSASIDSRRLWRQSSGSRVDLAVLAGSTAVATGGRCAARLLGGLCAPRLLDHQLRCAALRARRRARGWEEVVLTLVNLLSVATSGSRRRAADRRRAVVGPAPHVLTLLMLALPRRCCSASPCSPTCVRARALRASSSSSARARWAGSPARTSPVAAPCAAT
jgi:hypothetical protein